MMLNSTLRRGVLLVGATLALAGTPAAGQDLAARVGAVKDGAVGFSFPARPDVCGDGNNITVSGRRSSRRHADWVCEHGPVRVRLALTDGRVTDLDTHVGGRWAPSSGNFRDLGEVSGVAATDYLLGLAETDRGSAGRQAVFAATLGEGAAPWPRLLKLARSETAPKETRKAAVFWLGQAAGDVVAGDIETLATDSGERDIQEAAVFALSQRPQGEGVPALIRIVKGHDDPKVRKTALFWLGQSDDPRALALIEQLLGLGG